MAAAPFDDILEDQQHWIDKQAEVFQTSTENSICRVEPRAEQLATELKKYLVDLIRLYRGRFEQEPSDAMLGIFVQRFMEENYPNKDALDGT